MSDHPGYVLGHAHIYYTPARPLPKLKPLQISKKKVASPKKKR